MNKPAKKFVAYFTAIVMILTTLPMTVLAASFGDTDGHWANAAIEKWSSLGVLEGSNGNFRPNAQMTRAEMAVVMGKIMQYNVAASNTFSDLDQSWYTDAILKAVDAEVMSGTSSTTVSPRNNITREQAFTILGRALGVSESSTGATFSDMGDVSTWAAGYINALAAKGIVNGTNGKVNPKANITRAEVVTILDNAIKQIYGESGTYTDSASGVVVINTADVTLSGSTISGDLIIAEGVGEGDVYLDDVTVTGKLVVRGGGENSIHLRGNTKIQQGTKIQKKHGRVALRAEENASSGTIEAAGGTVVLSGNFGNVTISGDGAVVIIEEGTYIETLYVSGDASNITINGEVGRIIVMNDAADTNITVGEDGVVDEIITGASLDITNNGEIGSLISTNENVDNNVSGNKPDVVKTDESLSDLTGGSVPSVGDDSSDDGTETETTKTTTGTGGGSGGTSSSGDSDSGTTTKKVTSVSVSTETPMMNVALTATVVPSNATSPKYQWYYSDVSDVAGTAIGTDPTTSWVIISGATAASYTPVAKDKYLMVIVTGSSNSSAYHICTNAVVAQTFTVTFDSQGATTPSDPASVTGIASEATISLPTPIPVKTGYTFGGWFTEANGGGAEFTAATAVTANITVYAKWTVLKVGTPTVSQPVVDGNDATISGDTSNLDKYGVSSDVTGTGASADPYVITITGTAALKSFPSANSAQPVGEWVGVVLDIGVNITNIKYSSNGSTWYDLSAADQLEASDATNGSSTTDALVYWFIADDEDGSSKTIFLKYNGTEDSDATMITINYVPKAVADAALKAINEADSKEAMKTALETHGVSLGLNLTTYNSLSENGKLAVATAVYGTGSTTYDASTLKTAFDNAVTEHKANDDITAAIALITNHFDPIYGTDTNYITKLAGIAGMSDLGVTITLASANSAIANDGAITYGATSAVAGIVTIMINKAPGTEQIKGITVTVPAATSVILAADSKGTAGDKTITGLTQGNYYKVEVGTGTPATKYVKTNGTLSDTLGDIAALGSGKAITGLTNGTIYKVIEALPVTGIAAADVYFHETAATNAANVANATAVVDGVLTIPEQVSNVLFAIDIKTWVGWDQTDNSSTIIGDLDVNAGAITPTAFKYVKVGTSAALRYAWVLTAHGVDNTWVSSDGQSTQTGNGVPGIWIDPTIETLADQRVWLYADPAVGTTPFVFDAADGNLYFLTVTVGETALTPLADTTDVQAFYHTPDGMPSGDWADIETSADETTITVTFPAAIMLADTNDQDDVNPGLGAIAIDLGKSVLGEDLDESTFKLYYSEDGVSFAQLPVYYTEDEIDWGVIGTPITGAEGHPGFAAAVMPDGYTVGGTTDIGGWLVIYLTAEEWDATFNITDINGNVIAFDIEVEVEDPDTLSSTTELQAFYHTPSAMPIEGCLAVISGDTITVEFPVEILTANDSNASAIEPGLGAIAIKLGDNVLGDDLDSSTFKMYYSNLEAATVKLGYLPVYYTDNGNDWGEIGAHITTSGHPGFMAAVMPDNYTVGVDKVIEGYLVIYLDNDEPEAAFTIYGDDGSVTTFIIDVTTAVLRSVSPGTLQINVTEDKIETTNTNVEVPDQSTEENIGLEEI